MRQVILIVVLIGLGIPFTGSSQNSPMWKHINLKEPVNTPI